MYVRHDSTEPGSPLAPDHPGNAFKPQLTGEPALLVVKRVNSAFLGDPDLRRWLDEHGIEAMAICGITTNHCCETTARMAGNLGYDTRFVLDATHSFDREDLDGNRIGADELMRVSAANLQGEFATVVRTQDVLGGA